MLASPVAARGCCIPGEAMPTLRFNVVQRGNDISNERPESIAPAIQNTFEKYNFSCIEKKVQNVLKLLS
jgi:hypothetical protein